LRPRPPGGQAACVRSAQGRRGCARGAQRARRGPRVRPRAAGGRERGSAPARDRRRRGARRAGRPVPRRARADRGFRSGGNLRSATGGRPARRCQTRGRRREGALVMTTPLDVSLAGRDFLRIADLVPAEAETILDRAVELRRAPKQPLLPGATLGLYFAKHSTRTRVSFSAGVGPLRGAARPPPPGGLPLSPRGSPPRTAPGPARPLPPP